MADFKDHFSALAAQYADSRPHYPAALFEYLATLCPSRQRAWDCACGSGQATVSLAGHFDSVVGSDASDKQISKAIPHPRVQYRVGPAEHSDLDSHCVDLVTVAQALHWLAIDKFYAEADRVLKPGGILAVWCYGVQRLADERLDREVQAYYRDIVGPYWPPERVLVETGYRTLPFPFHELSPPPFTLTAEWSLPRLLGYFRSWSATGRYRAEKGVDPVIELGETLEKIWGPPEEPRSIAWPLALRVGQRRHSKTHTFSSKLQAREG